MSDNIFKSRFGKISFSLLALILTGIFYSCSDELSNKTGNSFSSDVSFSGLINGGNTLSTRSDELIPINPDDFGTTLFYIYELGFEKDNNDNQKVKAEVRPYWLQSGVEGQLDITTGYKKLNWFEPDTKHRFWSWTWPLGERDYSKVSKEEPEVKPGNEVIIFIHSDFPVKEDSKDKPSGTKAEPGDESGKEEGEKPEPEPETPMDPAKTWRNGEALERLVGTISDREYVFNEDGQYVPLTYRHLVSRIIMGEFILVDRTGAEQKELQARITFYGMPKRAMFYPLPAARENVSGENEEVAPYVTIDTTDPYGKTKKADVLTDENEIKNRQMSYDLKEYLTFYITNEGGNNTNTGTGQNADSNVHRDMFYICPEVDFGQLEYKVEFVKYDVDKKAYVPHPEFGMRGGYFGNFKAVQFVRGEEGTEEYTTNRILHAGEEMILNMKVFEKSGPGTGVWIRNWTTEKMKSATHHNHPGIYSDGESSLFRSAISSGTDSSYDAQKQEAFEMYGDPESPAEYKEEAVEKNIRVIRMYNDIICGISTSNNYATYYLYDDTKGNHYILDGMGFTLTFKNTYANGPKFECVYIGDVRDIYISNGETTVYIDKEGYVWRMDKKTGEYQKTEEKHEMNKPLYFEPKTS